MTATARDEPPGTTIRRLMRELPRAALGTLDRATGEPYVSLAMVAVAHDASPLLLLSDLADHTGNIKSDRRASLLFDGTAGSEVPLAQARASVQGKLVRIEDAALLDRYVRHHPDAAMYRGFSDFNFYRMTVDRAHLVAGFGRIHWVEAGGVLFDAAAAVATAEPGIVEHMNADHGEANELYAEVLLGRGGGSWTMTGVDPEGADLRLGGEVARVWFDEPALDAEAVRSELVRLVKRARDR